VAVGSVIGGGGHKGMRCVSACLEGLRTLAGSFPDK
jgi:hypothetical protein